MNQWHFPYYLLIRIACIFSGFIVLILLAIQTHDFGSTLTGPGAQTTAGLSLLGFYLLYMLLMLSRGHWSPWSRWSLIFIYLIATFSLTLVIGMVASPLLCLIGYASIAAIIIQARNAFGKSGLALICTVLALTIGCQALLPGTRITLPLSSLPVGLWLVGLAFLQTFTALGVHERTTRIRNEQQIRLLMITQQQLRAYALHAEEHAADRERMRVAREMHDTLAQGLAAIKMHLETSTQVFEPEPGQALEHLEQARLLAGEYLSKTRRSIAALRADSLQPQPLPQTLAQLATTWQECGLTIHIDVSSQAYLASIPISLAHTYSRITEEALNNAHTHGHAHHVEIELSLVEQKLCLAITDDGTGFEAASPEAYAQSGHFGIVGMYERAQAIQGYLDLISAPGTGTQVMVTAPLHNNPQGAPVL